MECVFLSEIFHILCLVAAGILFVRSVKDYVQGESSSEVRYRKFHQQNNKDIYPSISLCIWNDPFGRTLGFYDRKKLNDTYGIIDPLEYTRFLQGDIWQDKMLGVKYDDVTFDIKDRIDGIEVLGETEGMPKIAGMDVKYLYRWGVSTNGTNKTSNNLDSAFNSTQSFPIYTSYRHPHGKCFTLDLTVDKMPRIQGEVINSVHIRFKNIKIPDVIASYKISYPGQILRGFPFEYEVTRDLRVTSGNMSAKIFLFDSIEVFRKISHYKLFFKSSFYRPCQKMGKYDDKSIMQKIIETANCKPPHWGISVDYPVCNTKEKMKEVYIAHVPFKMASPIFLDKFEQPCDGILAATVNARYTRRKPSGHPTSSDRSNPGWLMFKFNNDYYKEIKYIQAHTVLGLIGNEGGIIGLILGVSLWQLPDALEYVIRKLNTLIGGKLYYILCFL